VRKLLFRAFVGSVVASALVACYALLVGKWSDTEARIVFTCLCVSAVSIQTLACAVALENRKLGPVPWVGIGASVLGFGMLIVAIWGEIEADDYIRTAVSFVIVATAVGHASLVALARLEARFRWCVLGVNVDREIAVSDL
jgi:hypothetical protein